MTRPCESGKVAYASRAQAQAALQHVRKRGPREPGGHKPTRAYICRSCGQWHLTSSPR